jgi:hypothetical protein
MISAAPAPCTVRAAISQPALGASAHAADAAANTAGPLAYRRRRPKRSPNAAAVINNTAKLRLYAFTVHSSCSTEACSFRRIVLSAVDTTSVSRTAINDPTPVNATTQRVALLLMPAHQSLLLVWTRDPSGARNPSVNAPLALTR